MSADAVWVDIADSACPLEDGLDAVCDIILDVTGEQHTRDSLMDLAFDTRTSMYLTHTGDVKGAMLIETRNHACWKVVVMVVARELQRAGHGSIALASLKELAARRVATSIILDVRVDNEHAIEFYREHGFEVISTESGFYHGIDGYRMSLAL